MREKDKIIEFSKNTFLKNGFHKVTMDEIASGLRISKKTIYKYFQSKNELVNAVVRIYQKNIKKQLNEAVDSKENSILKMKALAEFMAEFSINIDKRMLYDLQAYRPELWKKIDNFRIHVIEEIWINIINAGKKEKNIINKPNDIIITIILGSIKEIINPVFLLNHSYSMKQAFEITFEIILSGILTEKGKKLYYKSILESKK